MGTDFQSCILYETNLSGANLTVPESFLNRLLRRKS